MATLYAEFFVIFALILVTVDSQSGERKQCTQKSDIVFVVDSSGSISRRNFKREKLFVEEVASTFKMGPDQSQIAVISYSESAQVDIKFGEYTNVNDFTAALGEVRHQRKRTRIDLALKLAAEKVFTAEGGARPNVTKVMVILTDGQQTETNDSTPLDEAVRPLLDMNVTIFAVGVGSAIDITELLELVGYKDENLFRAENFDQLARDSVKVATQTCKQLQPVHGNWSAWAQWSDCSASCGGGIQGRRRYCINPPPKNGGRDCSGKGYDVQRCNTQGCPVNGSWTEWSDWGSCSLTCGDGGIKKRIRTCTNPPPANGGLECEGAGEETEACKAGECPVDGKWGEWSDWGVCSRSCGTGIQSRFRDCDNPPPAHGGKQCPGSSTETRNCSTNNCPVDGGWTVWNQWGRCSKSCGGGSQTSSRTCTNPPPAHGGKECSGESERSRECNTQPCPIDGRWSEWNQWGTCSKSCGGGTQNSSRTCINPPPAHGGKNCSGESERTRECNTQPCPIDGSWSDWREWGPCTKSCGGGEQRRTRSCTNPSPAFGGRNCIGERQQTRTCNQNVCPVDGQWSRWTDWTICSRTCGIGLKKRSRTCTEPAPAHGGKGCEGSADETRECSERICPVDGGWSEWKGWTLCSASCGNGTQERERWCTEPRPEFGGKDCDGISRETKTCQTIPCPVHGQWSEWKDWTSCSKTCGTGTQERERSCTNPPPAFGGEDCVGLGRQIKSCQEEICAVHGGWSPWKDWGPCTKTCGSGQQTRERKCDSPRPEHGGRPCEGSGEQVRVCNTRQCPIDGQWSEWKPWTVCTRTCGGGVQTRARTCTQPSPAYGGKDCEGRIDETRPCGTDACPVDGSWTEWTEWRECSRSCGGGFHSRSRTCTNPRPKHGGKNCSGRPDETRPCNTQTCPVDGQWSDWTDWTACSKLCGTGERERTRTCTKPAPTNGGKQCSGRDRQTQECNVQPCTGCSEIADIAFLVDASESMTEKDFEKEKDVIKKVAATFDVGETKSHLGLISFSSNANIDVKFGDLLDLRSFQDEVDKIPFSAGGTRFDKAFGVAANGLFSPNGGVRSNLPKVLIILTDGKQSADFDAVPVEKAVLPLRHLGVRVFVLAIGSQIDMVELQQMVTNPKDILVVNKFDELLDDVKKIGNKTCETIKRPELLCTEKADVAFLMDGSESMTEQDFEKQKDFVTRVAESFHMTPTMTQFALITYSSSANLHIRFKDHMNQSAFSTIVRQLPFAAGGTRFDKAIKLAAENVFTEESGARPGVPKVMIILTDGQQSQEYDALPLQQAVLPLHRLSVQVHAVAIGNQVKMAELRKLVQKEEDIFSIKDFDNLIDKSRQLARKTCDIITRPPQVVKCSDDTDVAFVVDTSGSISDENFVKQKDFIKVLASAFDPSIEDHQLGLISYSSDAQVEVSFRDKADAAQFESAVDRVPHTKGRTRLDKALALAATQMFSTSGGTRSGKRKIMVILTDGRQSQDPDTIPLQEAVSPLRKLGVRVYTVAIGDEVDLNELYQVTEGKEDVFPVSDFANLANMATDIASKTCKVKAFRAECKERINLAFVMDMSSSITAKNYPKQKDFIKRVADTFSISETQTDVGVITYNREAKLWISFGQYNNNNEFKDAVDKIPYWGGQTRIDNGLEMAAVSLFGELKGGREKLPNVLILLTDGQQSSDLKATPLEEAVVPLFQLGVKVFAVGVGDQFSRDELRLIVEKDRDIFAVNDFDDLLTKSHEIARTACDAAENSQGSAGNYQPKSCFKNIDVGFTVDSSDSVGEQGYQKQKQLVQRLSSFYDISKQDTRIGVVIYGDKAFTTIGMNSYRDSSILQRAVGFLPRLGGGNRKEKALVAARKMFKAKRPPSQSGASQPTKVLVFITEGPQSATESDTFSLHHAVHPLERNGVRVIAVGIGSKVVYQELRSLVLDSNDIYLTTSLDDVDKVSRDLIKLICKY